MFENEAIAIIDELEDAATKATRAWARASTLSNEETRKTARRHAAARETFKQAIKDALPEKALERMAEQLAETLIANIENVALFTTSKTFEAEDATDVDFVAATKPYIAVRRVAIGIMMKLEAPKEAPDPPSVGATV
jgi:hypothetical protein